MQTERPVRGTRYEDDYVLWADEQAAALAEGRFADLDLVNLADEIGSLSGRDRRELTSRLRVILVHLLKRAYQPERATNSWKRSAIMQAGKIEVLVFLTSLVISDCCGCSLGRGYCEPQGSRRRPQNPPLAATPVTARDL